MESMGITIKASGDFQLHRDLRVALAELDQHRIQQFVQHSGGLLHRHLLAVDAGDGKQILHHAGQPLGITAGFAKQLMVFSLSSES